MTDIQPENRAFYWATLFLRSLQAHGLKHVIISPGSRSTPLTMAAAALTKLEKHVILDERSAAFLALGIGKATNQPAALICTSGTAVANYFPAVVEARKSSVPLLLLTADRPPHLQHTGANQTINQQRIFGDYPVFFHDVGEPIMNNTDYAGLTRLAGQAQQFSIDRQGPVHINFPFRKPLEPSQDFLAKISEENRSFSNSPASQKRQKKIGFDDEILYKIHESDKPLIIIGQLSPAVTAEPIFKLAEQLKAPVLSERGILNADYAIQGFEGFLRNDDDILSELEPDLILRFGLQPASKSVLQAVKKWKSQNHIYFSDTGNWSDIGNSTSNFVQWNGVFFDEKKLPGKSARWLKKWKLSEQDFAEKRASVLAEKQLLTDGHVYQYLSPKIPNNWAVFVSNSFPARDQSLFGRWKEHQPIFTNRGVSGIDGITSTAMGVTIGRNQPAILFTGDLAFLHDTNALLNHQKLPQPLIIVVINNQGGSIFRMLPIAKHAEYFNSYFQTPQIADIASLVEGYGIDFTLVETVEKLQQLEPAKIVESSKSKVHVVECRTDADASMEIRNKLWGISDAS